MKKRFPSITINIWSITFFLVFLAIWQGLHSFELVPRLILPSPGQVTLALINELPNLIYHAQITMYEALLGLLLSLFLSFFLAILMERFEPLYQGLYPILVISQTVPVVALAPLLVLWLGYGIAPKITLVILVCFFPMSIALLDGFKSADRDAIYLLYSMGANRWQVLWHIKLPNAMPGFFSGLKISVAYAFVGAVIAEWLGGNRGLGVYMTRVKKAYAFDKMFAVIILIICISLLFMALSKLVERKVLAYRYVSNTGKDDI